jgi:transposase
VKGEYKVHIIGHGYKDKYGTEILADKDGKLMAQGIRGLEKSIRDIPYAKLANFFNDDNIFFVVFFV